MRKMHLICSGGLLVALCAYCGMYPPVLQPSSAERDNAIGQELQVFSGARVIRHTTRGFVFEQAETEYEVKSDLDQNEIPLGSLVSLRGTWCGNQVIDASAVHFSTRRSQKVWISIAALPVIAWLWATTFYFDFRTLTFRARHA